MGDGGYEDEHEDMCRLPVLYDMRRSLHASTGGGGTKVRVYAHVKYAPDAVLCSFSYYLAILNGCPG